MTKHEANRPLWALDAIIANPAVTVRELMDVMGLASTSAVEHHLRRLEDAGLLRREPCPHCGRSARNLIVTDEGYDARGLKVA